MRASRRAVPPLARVVVTTSVSVEPPTFVKETLTGPPSSDTGPATSAGVVMATWPEARTVTRGTGLPSFGGWDGGGGHPPRFGRVRGRWSG